MSETINKSQVLVTRSKLERIADAIRYKYGGQKPAPQPELVADIYFTSEGVKDRVRKYFRGGSYDNIVDDEFYFNNDYNEYSFNTRFTFNQGFEYDIYIEMGEVNTNRQPSWSTKFLTNAIDNSYIIGYSNNSWVSHSSGGWDYNLDFIPNDINYFSNKTIHLKKKQRTDARDNPFAYSIFIEDVEYMLADDSTASDILFGTANSRDGNTFTGMKIKSIKIYAKKEVTE